MKALDQMRDEIIPATVGGVDGTTVNVTGDAASSADFSSNLKTRLPLIFAFVFGLAFLLLLVTFRSIVIPITAIVLNLMSVGAAYGILVLVFQNGNGESVLGFTSNGGVTNWLPLFLFVVLFGLSMDYHVFILSRIKELYDRGMSTDEAVKQGISTTAGTVTSAAIVMVGVFAVFITLSFLDFKELGLGLAAAVLIDATIIRGVLLPASMKLLGDWNWYLPELARVAAANRRRGRRARAPEGAAGPGNQGRAAAGSGLDDDLDWSQQALDACSSCAPNRRAEGAGVRGTRSTNGVPCLRALLRQPHGFEGLALARCRRATDALPVDATGSRARLRRRRACRCRRRDPHAHDCHGRRLRGRAVRQPPG